MEGEAVSPSVSPDGNELPVTGTHRLSVDSRQVGPVSKMDITGKVIRHIKKLRPNDPLPPI
jgi:hypothetical protein